jgi:hypothetical protein
LFLLTELDPSGTAEIPFQEADLLQDELRERGAEPTVVDVAAYPDGPPITVTETGSATLEGKRLEPTDFESAVIYPQFLFRLHHYRQLEELTEDPVGTLNQLREHRGLFESWLTILAEAGVRLTCPPDAMPTHQRKLWQMHTLARRDLPVPDSMVTTDPDAVRSFVDEHGRAVAKPVSGGYVPEVITLEDLSDERLAVVEQTPLQLQTYAPGDDVRAYVVGDSCVGAMRYEYTDERFSFKATDADQEVESVEHEAPPEIHDAVERAAKACNLSFAAVDLRHDRETGEFNIIELNPGGRFAMAHEAGVDVAGPLADWLVDGN